MKLHTQEKQTLSDAIDKLNEGLDSFIQLYNDAEEDKPLIEFDDEATTIIERAKKIYGNEEIDQRMNKIVKEILSLIPLNQKDSPQNEEE
ncbi:atypical membrane-integrating protein (Mistic protein) [Bacillus suaedaesalsae]|uniref:Atypical membrane-integrating protein (Mistic protein) n=1 Tax=Bacillus suaedaesalsae TaxID=2810349 RepID=A0ABS2DJR7_9BACI|nr:atypical membrane-integrating protein (Mistic protein) [Bacillus suaedaesalsae]MBM6618737.1 atypical membrane-integrating protein (Mistic protein) [Bacillus suaedaesalsae]